MYGFTFNKETREKTGEIDTLRYSAYDCWSKSKDSYRKRYYEGQSFMTPETLFGHQTHKALEKGEMVIKGLPRYSMTEYNIEEEIGAGKNRTKIGGCLDSFDPNNLSFLDYKSSHRDKNGKAPWDAVKVARHTQLVFYSLLVKKRYGKVDPYTKLIWLETEFEADSREFMGHVLTAETRKLRLTGHFQVFMRRIAEWERRALQKKIMAAAQEIKEDFIRYKQTHG